MLLDCPRVECLFLQAADHLSTGDQLERVVTAVVIHVLLSRSMTVNTVEETTPPRYSNKAVNFHSLVVSLSRTCRMSALELHESGWFITDPTAVQIRFVGVPTKMASTLCAQRQSPNIIQLKAK